jgi:hypothetical protein
MPGRHRFWHTVDETTIRDDDDPRFLHRTTDKTIRESSISNNEIGTTRLERLGIVISDSMRYKTRLGNPFGQMRYLLRVLEKIVWLMRCDDRNLAI